VQNQLGQAQHVHALNECKWWPPHNFCFCNKLWAAQETHPDMTQVHCCLNTRMRGDGRERCSQRNVAQGGAVGIKRALRVVWFLSPRPTCMQLERTHTHNTHPPSATISFSSQSSSRSSAMIHTPMAPSNAHALPHAHAHARTLLHQPPPTRAPRT
jgi:hypothetical protein